MLLLVYLQKMEMRKQWADLRGARGAFPPPPTPLPGSIFFRAHAGFSGGGVVAKTVNMYPYL